ASLREPPFWSSLGFASLREPPFWSSLGFASLREPPFWSSLGFASLRETCVRPAFAVGALAAVGSGVWIGVVHAARFETRRARFGRARRGGLRVLDAVGRLGPRCGAPGPRRRHH